MDFSALYEKAVDPRIEKAARYFEGLAPGTALPRRHDFRPEKVRDLLGFIFLIDILPEENDFHFSLFGVHMAVLYGADLSNRKLSEIRNPAQRDALRQSYELVVATQNFVYLRGHYAWFNRSVGIERLLVPMCDNDGKLTTIFGLAVPDIPADMLIVYTGNGSAKFEADPA